MLPGTGRLPVVLSIPHSGTDYPKWLIADSRRGLSSLLPLEDPLVDRLAWRAIALGCPALIARAPRAAVDCNRSLDEIDPASGHLAPGADPGPRARAGLGIVPTRAANGSDLWRSRISAREVERRIAEGWAPYHRALADLIDQSVRRHGEILLLDLHSMPARRSERAGIVVGNRHGQSSAQWLTNLIRQTIEADDLPVRFNDPYAGGWIVESLGKPFSGVHAVQLELDRRLYLDSSYRHPGQAFDRMSRLIEAIARTLGGALLDRNALPAAAE